MGEYSTSIEIYCTSSSDDGAMNTMQAALRLLCTSLATVSGLSSIRVFDNVLAGQANQFLHQVASDSGLSHKLFVRAETPRSPLEHALDALLTQANDSSPLVEYWCRQEWRHIEAHADIDEFLAKTDPNKIRYPSHGHVLYLKIGEQTKGPTCLFENAKSGGELSQQSKVSLVTVPAVENRLLRFPGDILHAVPRPTDLWLLPFVKGAPDFDPVNFGRSVVLFNTWQDTPPLKVPQLEKAANACPEELQLRAAHHTVNRARDWNEVDIQTNGPSRADATKKTKIWLLGDLNRRQHELRTLHLYSNEESLREVLSERVVPHRISLCGEACGGPDCATR